MGNYLHFNIIVYIKIILFSLFVDFFYVITFASDFPDFLFQFFNFLYKMCHCQ